MNLIFRSKTENSTDQK